jgi:hypothetical protein
VRLNGRTGTMTAYKNKSVNTAIKTVDIINMSELRHLRNGISWLDEQGKGILNMVPILSITKI